MRAVRNRTRKRNTQENSPWQAQTTYAGGMTPRTAFSKGCVGTTRSTHGMEFSFASGYQLRTTRASMANVKKLRKGSKKAAVGCTQAWVSANVSVLQEDKTSDISNVGNMFRAVVVVEGIFTAVGALLVRTDVVGLDADGQKPLATPNASAISRATFGNPFILIKTRGQRGGSEGRGGRRTTLATASSGSGGRFHRWWCQNLFITQQCNLVTYNNISHQMLSKF